ncbi:hypothetical protein CERZMDRAFT_47467 [Cercospora zeae-maydis SCOH1-5]|uniref:Gag1-like clamp domain-containing protein n=1 Tax=Cercospora zeae-maydis SCOH1-5 TaxID=717836 RepID=A0A6A6F787_9PEZI|nr:hypothetical protein CERZMDRAFT_47467 [Cercospora zeae-maydis SCOH1-5]
MTLHLNLPGAHHRNAEQQAELREARRLLKDKVRNDWAYPPLPAWKERDVSDCSDTEAEGQAMSTSTPASARKAATSKDSVYKFDGPDSVGTQLNDHRLARKRKRHQALQDEMEWNDGLAHWTRRRDVWWSSPSATPDAAVTTAASASTTSLDVLVPIAPPLLPNHPVRRRITTNMYPEIYNKIIVQSRTPSVPINLLTLIHALIQGWKTDGEWPPKVGPIDKSIGRMKGAGAGHEGSLRQGVKAVGRVLRLTGVSEHG